MSSNFKQHGKRPSRPVPIDGIISPNNVNHTTQGRINQQFSQAYQPGQSTVLGDFGRPDGYHSNQSTVASDMLPSPVSPMPQQYIQEEPVKKRSRRQKRKDRSRSKGRRFGWRWTLRTCGIIVLIGLIVVGFLGVKGYLKGSSIFRGGGAAAALEKNVDPVKLRGEGDGRVNVLILGKGGPGHDGADLTDTVLLASVDPVQKEAALLSIPRDMWVKTSGGSSMKINAVYATAKQNALAGTKRTRADIESAEKVGVTAVERSVTEVIGLPVHYYIMVDFEAFRKSIDTVGGITIDVKTALVDPTVAWELHGNPVIAPVGVQTFDGNRALFYARSRHGSARGDFDRTERQRQVMVALKDKVLNLGTFANPIKVSQLMDAFGDHVRTDINKNEISAFYELGKSTPSNKIASVGLADPPHVLVKTGNINGQSIVMPVAGVFEYDDIKSYVRNSLRDAFLKSEDAKIIVLNGTTVSGLANKKATELKSYGYNVTSVGDAPTKTYQKTILVDLTKGAKKYTKNYLEKRVGVTAVTSLPDPKITSTADFVIILGTN